LIIRYISKIYLDNEQERRFEKPDEGGMDGFIHSTLPVDGKEMPKKDRLRRRCTATS
jgi:hypothetical protein